MADHLQRLRSLMAAQAIDALLVPRADEHLGEYVPPCGERLAFLTGFTGSAGLAIVTATRAALFVDGRYTEQAAQEIDPHVWEQLHLIEQPPPIWLRSIQPAATLGYDPWLHSEDQIASFTKAGLQLRPLERNLVDAIWDDRPAPPRSLAVPHPLVYAGEDSAAKRQSLAETLHQDGVALAVLSDPASIAWLLNIRGQDLPYLPVALAFALLRDDGSVRLFIDPEKIPAQTRAWLGDQVDIEPPDRLPAFLAGLAGCRVMVDPANNPAWFAQSLRAMGAEIVAGSDPCILPKACKNAAEQQGAKAAHRRDAVAMCRFLHWLDTSVPSQNITEMQAAAQLLAFRRDVPDFRGESFPAISAAGPHAALPHYRSMPASNAVLEPNSVYLIDSGGQYPDGTTDITRTIWIGPHRPLETLRTHYTLVLKGHIALARQIFPQGVGGVHLDALARQFLWAEGLDFDHGTGHGVGSYLSVHEGPASISRAARRVQLAEGMILSNEPGFYLPGSYGIRLENLVLVQPHSTTGGRTFLRFDTISLAPFDAALIATDLLTRDEKDWLHDYHRRVEQELFHHLPQDAQNWLHTACTRF